MNNKIPMITLMITFLAGLVYFGYAYTSIKADPPIQELYTKSILMIGNSWLQLKEDWRSFVPKETTYSKDWAYIHQHEQVGMIGVRYRGEQIHHFRSFIGAIRRAAPDIHIRLIVHDAPSDFVDEASKWIGVTVVEDVADWTTFDSLSAHIVKPHDMFVSLNEESQPRPGCYLHSSWQSPPITHPNNQVPKLCMCVSIVNNGRSVIRESSFFEVVL